jgi:hypothetical protein
MTPTTSSPAVAPAPTAQPSIYGPSYGQIPSWSNAPVHHHRYGPNNFLDPRLINHGHEQTMPHGALDFIGHQQAMDVQHFDGLPLANTYQGYGTQHGRVDPGLSGPMHAPVPNNPFTKNDAYILALQGQRLPNLTPGFAPANRFADPKNLHTNGATDAGNGAHARNPGATSNKRKRTPQNGGFAQTLAAMNDKRGCQFEADI